MASSSPDAVLLDRDGTINVKAPEGDYITAADQLTLLPGAAEAVRTLNDAGIPTAVVTNQRGIALGRMTEGDLALVHVRLRNLLADEGASLGPIFHCPHEKDMCACRKPGALLLERARVHLGLDTLAQSVMIGDSPADVLAGRRAGARTVLLDPAREGSCADSVAPTLLAAVQRLLATAA